MTPAAGGFLALPSKGFSPESWGVSRSFSFAWAGSGNSKLGVARLVQVTVIILVPLRLKATSLSG